MHASFDGCMSDIVFPMERRAPQSRGKVKNPARAPASFRTAASIRRAFMKMAVVSHCVHPAMQGAADQGEGRQPAGPQRGIAHQPGCVGQWQHLPPRQPAVLRLSTCKALRPAEPLAAVGYLKTHAEHGGSVWFEFVPQPGRSRHRRHCRRSSLPPRSRVPAQHSLAQLSAAAGSDHNATHVCCHSTQQAGCSSGQWRLAAGQQVQGYSSHVLCCDSGAHRGQG